MLLLHLASLALLAPPSNQVHPVGDEAAFLAALQAASPGDTILIQAPLVSFDEPIQLSKGLQVSGGPGAALRVPGGFVVEDLPAQEEVAFRGIAFSSLNQTATTTYCCGAAVLTIRDCLGPVHIMGCSFSSPNGFQGLRVERSESVFLSSCTVEGGGAVYVPFGTGPTFSAGAGIYGVESDLFLQDVTAIGGNGTIACSSALISADRPQPGIHLIDSDLIAVNSAGEGRDGLKIFCGGPCSIVPGSSGLLGDGASTAVLKNCVFQGGTNPPTPPDFCPQFGVPDIDGFEELGSSAVESNRGTSFSLSPWSAIADGSLTLSVQTPPAEFAFALVASDASPAWPVAGIDLYLTPFPPIILDLGPANGAGEISKSYPLPSAGQGAVEAWVQVVSIDPLGQEELQTSFAAGLQRVL